MRKALLYIPSSPLDGSEVAEEALNGEEVVSHGEKGIDPRSGAIEGFGEGFIYNATKKIKGKKDAKETVLDLESFGFF